MRILQVNTTDIMGGAARAAYRLHRGLLSLGAESTLFVRDKYAADNTVRQFIPDPSAAAAARRVLAKVERDAEVEAYASTRAPRLELFSHERVDADEDFFVQRPPADIINLHWISEFIDYRLFFTPERTAAPVVWTLHDMNPATGGCHFDDGCGKFESHCGACPLLGATEERDLTWRIFESKRRILDAWPADRLHIVGPSRWARDMSRASALLRKFPATWIAPGIDTDVFRPKGKEAARNAYKLPQDAQIVLFMCHDVASPRKGLRELISALALLPDDGRLLLLVLGDKRNAAGISAPFRMAFSGYLEDATVSGLCSAADVTAVPSRQDVGPLTVLESLSCGTPVVAFDMGGVPDVVSEGETGFLAPAGSIPGLRAAFIRAFSDPERLRLMGARGRELAEKKFSERVQAAAYLELYQRLVEDAHAKGVRAS